MRYFAYCTLLDLAEMRKFCPGAEPTVVASLSGYRVVFGRYPAGSEGGGCQLEAAPGHEIYGLIYELSADEFDQLDRISGVDRGYYKRVGFIVSTPTRHGIASSPTSFPTSRTVSTDISLCSADSGGRNGAQPTAAYVAELERPCRRRCCRKTRRADRQSRTQP